jgi:hypothetical protein
VLFLQQKSYETSLRHRIKWDKTHKLARFFAILHTVGHWFVGNAPDSWERRCKWSRCISTQVARRRREEEEEEETPDVVCGDGRRSPERTSTAARTTTTTTMSTKAKSKKNTVHCCWGTGRRMRVIGGVSDRFTLRPPPVPAIVITIMIQTTTNMYCSLVRRRSFGFPVFASLPPHRRRRRRRRGGRFADAAAAPTTTAPVVVIVFVVVAGGGGGGGVVCRGGHGCFGPFSF